MTMTTGEQRNAAQAVGDMLDALQRVRTLAEADRAVWAACDELRVDVLALADLVDAVDVQAWDFSRPDPRPRS